MSSDITGKVFRGFDMYTLIITSGERDAFDFVGDRYNNGDAMADILRSCMPDGEEFAAQAWYEPGDVTIKIPEHKAWEIRELYEEDCQGGHSGWAMFADELVEKMQEFVDSIV